MTTAINDSTFLRSFRNLANEQSAGFEPAQTLSLGGKLRTNLNGNVFYEQIDTSNIGFAGKKSVTSWSGTCNVTVTPSRATIFEMTSTDRSARLTPQGNARPSFGLNVGARLDVAGIEQHVTNRRDSRVVYVGLTYHYGRPDKQEKALPYEDQP